MDNCEPNSPTFLRNRFGERYLPDVNRRSFADEPSKDVYDRHFSEDLEAEDTLFVFVGSDSGLLHDYLRGLPLGKGSRRLVVEADELFPLIEPHVASTGEAPTFSRFGEWAEALGNQEIDSYALGGRVSVVESLGCVHDHGGRYAQMLREIRAHVAAELHARRAQVNGQSFIRTQLQNVCENRLPASLLRGIGEGHTAMVLGGGPSFDDNIGWVQDNRESLFLIVASRLCGRLRSLGICPDVVVSVDPKSSMFDLGKEGLLWPDTALVNSHHLDPQLLQQWRGPTLYVGTLFPWSDPRAEADGNFTGAGPTVSHFGAWLAFCCGFELILMSGVDMCFAAGGSSHESGSVERMISTLPLHYNASVITYDGRTAGTLHALELGIRSMEQLGRSINLDGDRLFNISPGAARIESIPLIDPADVKLGGSRPAIPSLGDTTAPADHLQRVRREQTNSRRHFREILRRCDEAKRLLSAMEKAREDAAYEKARHRLERLEKNLDKDHGRWFATIKSYAAAELLATCKPSGFGDEESETRDWGRNYYRVIKRTAKMFIDLLDEGDRRVTMRLAELEAEPDVDALIAYWAEEQTPGRVLQLRSRLAADAPPPIVARIDDAAQAFLATLERTETVHRHQVHATTLKPSNLLRNLVFMASEELEKDLSLMIPSLRALPAPHDVFADYADGLHADLAKDGARALQSYQLVIERFGSWIGEAAGIPKDFDILLEETLRRIVRCQLGSGDGEAAVGSLALLSQISPAYTTRLAKLQQLLGRRDQALQTLEQHVLQFPGDWRALLQMTDVLLAANAPEAAEEVRSMARKVREQEENPTAHRPADLAA